MKQLSKYEAELMYKDELAMGSISTEDTPHYDSLNEYINMLIDMGFKITEDNK